MTYNEMKQSLKKQRPIVRIKNKSQIKQKHLTDLGTIGKQMSAFIQTSRVIFIP